MKVMLTWLCAVLAVAGVRGYTQGFPRDSCVTMFPMDYGVDAQTSPPPYELLVSPTTLNQPGQEFTVTLRSTDDPTWYFEEVFVQARMDTCNTYNSRPLGHFRVAPNDDFLQVIDCDNDRPQSAVTHLTNARHYVKQFTWTAPMSEPGNFYFRATVVKNSTTFWTNVFSIKVHDVSDDSGIVVGEYCDVCTQYDTCSAPSLMAMTSVLVAAVVTSLWCF